MNTLQIYFSFLYPFEIIPNINILKDHIFNINSNRRILNINWLFFNIKIFYKI
jgi:hypothetical protein